MRWNRIAATALLAALGICTAQAADPVGSPIWPVAQYEALFQPTRFTEEQTKSLIAALTAPDFATREAATRDLERHGIDAYPGLKEASTSDPELHARIQSVLLGTHFAIPDLPMHTRWAIQNYIKNRDVRIEEAQRTSSSLLPARIVSLLQPDHVEALSFLRVVEPQEPNETLREGLRQVHRIAADDEARLLVAAGRIPAAEELLRSVVERNMYSRADYAAFLALRRGEIVDPARELDRFILVGDPREELAALLNHEKGDDAQAAFHAHMMRYDDAIGITRPFLVAAERYEVLGHVKYPALADPILDTTRILALVLSNTPENLADADARVAAAIREFPTAKNTIAGINFRLLIRTGHTAEALNLAHGNASYRIPSFRLLCRQLRIREAMALVSPDDLETTLAAVDQLNELGLPQAAETLIRALPAEPKIANNASTAQAEFNLARAYDQVGEKTRADNQRIHAFSLADDAGERQSARQARINDLAQQMDAISKTLRAKSRDGVPLSAGDEVALEAELRRLSDLRDAQGANSGPPAYRIEIVFDPALTTAAQRAEAAFWASHLHSHDPATGRREHYARAMSIVRGEVPPQELRKLLTLDYFSLGARAELSIGARRLFFMGREDLALEFVKAYVARYSDPGAYMYAGDWLLERNNPKAAAAYYLQAAPAAIADCSLMYRLSLALSRVPETRSQGDQLRNLLPWMVLADPVAVRSVADAMNRFEGPGIGDAWFDAHLSPFATEYERGHHLDRLRRAAEARGDFAAALKFARQTLFYPVLDRFEQAPQYLSFMGTVALYHRSRALDASARKDAPTLADALNRHLDNAAPDVALLQKTIPTLKTLDPAAAKSILTRAIDRLQPIAEDYPAAKHYADQLQALKALQ